MGTISAIIEFAITNSFLLYLDFLNQITDF